MNRWRDEPLPPPAPPPPPRRGASPSLSLSLGVVGATIVAVAVAAGSAFVAVLVTRVAVAVMIAGASVVVVVRLRIEGCEAPLLLGLGGLARRRRRRLVVGPQGLTEAAAAQAASGRERLHGSRDTSQIETDDARAILLGRGRGENTMRHVGAS